MGQGKLHSDCDVCKASLEVGGCSIAKPIDGNPVSLVIDINTDCLNGGAHDYLAKVWADRLARDEKREAKRETAAI